MEKVFRVSTNLTEDENSNMSKRIGDEEKASIDILYSFDITDMQFITTYLICDITNLLKVEYLLIKHSVKFKTEDITEQFMHGEVEVDDEQFKSYLNKNLTIDIVLDKICKTGIESLSELDRMALKK